MLRFFYFCAHDIVNQNSSLDMFIVCFGGEPKTLNGIGGGGIEGNDGTAAIEARAVE